MCVIAHSVSKEGLRDARIGVQGLKPPDNDLRAFSTRGDGWGFPRVGNPRLRHCVLSAPQTRHPHLRSGDGRAFGVILGIFGA